MNRDALTAYVLAKKNGGGGGQGRDGKSAYEIAIENGTYLGSWTTGVRCDELLNTDTSTVEDMITNGDYFSVAYLETGISSGQHVLARASFNEFNGGVYVMGKILDYRATSASDRQFTIDPDEPYLVDYDDSSYSDDRIVTYSGMAGDCTEAGWLESLQGKTPEKGVDYFTSADIADIVDDVIAELNDADTSSY